MAMDYAVNSFREIASGQMGLKSMIMFESESAKAMAAFGGSRMMSLMMAGTMSDILIKFGGSAFAHMLSQTASSRDGMEAAKKAVDPTSRAAAMKGPAEAMPVQAVAGGYSFRDRVTAGATDQFGRIETSLGAAERPGGGISGPMGGMTAGIRSGGARSLQAAGQVYSREQKKLIAAQTFRNEDRVEQSLQKYQVNASESQASAVEQLAQEWGKTPHEVMRLMEKAKIGNFKGLKQAYDSAKETGFKGSIDDYTATMARVDKMGGFENSAAVEKFAKENGFSSPESFLKAQAGYRRSQDASMIKELQEQSADGSTGDIGAVLGRAQAQEAMAKHDYIKDVGKEGVYLQSAGKLYNEASKMTVRQALDDIAKTGSVSRDTQNLLKGIEGSRIGRAMLAAQGIGDRIIKPDEAQNFSSWLGSRGTNVDAEQLEGATAQMNVWADKGGNLHPSLLVSKAGQMITSMNYGTKQFADGRGYHQEKVSPETGKAVRGHTEKGTSATTYNDHDQLKGGPDMSSNTMWNLAMSGDEEIARRIDSATTRAGRDKEETTQAQALAAAILQKITHVGNISSVTDAQGNATITFKPGGVLGTIVKGTLGVGGEFKGKVALGRKNKEEYNYNLVYGTIRRIQGSAWKNAEQLAQKSAMRSDGTLDSKTYNDVFKQAYGTQYTQGLYNLSHGIDAAAQQKTEFSFGASGIVGEPWENLKNPSSQTSNEAGVNNSPKIIRREVHWPKQ